MSCGVRPGALGAGDEAAIAAACHAEHDRLYGYSLAEQEEPIEIINIRVQALGATDKPDFAEMDRAAADPAAALKGRRQVHIPEDNEFRAVPIYDGHALEHGNMIVGPAMIEEETTAIFVSAGFDCVVDKFGSFAIYLKGRGDLVASTLQGGSA